jgi:hypothetical protein
MHGAGTPAVTRVCNHTSRRSLFVEALFHICDVQAIKYVIPWLNKIVSSAILSCVEKAALYVGNMQAVRTGNLLIGPHNTERKAGAYEDFTICAEGLARTVPAR